MMARSIKVLDGVYLEAGTGAAQSGFWESELLELEGNRVQLAILVKNASNIGVSGLKLELVPTLSGITTGITPVASITDQITFGYKESSVATMTSPMYRVRATLSDPGGGNLAKALLDAWVGESSQ